MRKEFDLVCNQSGEQHVAKAWYWWHADSELRDKTGKHLRDNLGIIIACLQIELHGILREGKMFTSAILVLDSSVAQYALVPNWFIISYPSPNQIQ